MFEKERGGVEVFFLEKQSLRRESGGWKEGSSEDKCALSFQSERNPSLEAHIYMNRRSLEKAVFGMFRVVRPAERTMDDMHSSASQSFDLMSAV